MKRIIVIIFATLMLLSLVACGKSAAPTWQEQYDLGVRYLSEENYEEAIIAFTAAIEIDPKRAEAYIGRGDTYIALANTSGNLSSAIEDYEKAISIDATNSAVWLSLTDAYLLQGDVDGALRVLKDALTQLSDDTAIKEKQGMIESGVMRVERQDFGGQYSILEYNFNNLVVKETRYNEDGSIFLSYVYEYDQNGVKIKEIRYRADGTLQDMLEYDASGNLIRRSSNSVTHADESDPNSIDYMSEYDEHGNKIRCTYFNPDGSVDFYTEDVFDSAGHPIRTDFYEPDGTLFLYSINEYDLYGNRVKSETYDADGTLSSSETSEYDDEHAVISSERLQYMDGYLFQRDTLSRDSTGQGTWHHEQYDARGNVIASW